MTNRTLTYVFTGRDSSLSSTANKAGKHVESSFERIGKSLGGLAATMGKVGLASGAVFGAEAIKQGIAYNANLEQAKVGFTTMLGSAQKAGSFLKSLQSFAAKTPFNFPDLVTASQRMIAFGFSAKDVIPNLTAIGDAAAGLGIGSQGVEQITNAIGQMQAKTRVQSDEILQLTEAGVPALRILANEYHVTTKTMQDMITKGVVQSSVAIPKLLEGIERGTRGAAGATTKFGGLMAAQSHTLTGVFSNFVDVANQRLGQLVAPAIPLIEKGLSWLTNAFSGQGPTGRVFRQFGTIAGQVFHNIGDFISRTVAPALAHLFAIARPGFVQMIDVIKKNWESIQILWRALKPIVGPLIGAALLAIVGAFRLIAWTEDKLVAPAIRGIAIALSGVIGFFKKLVLVALDVWGKIIHGAATVFGWLPFGAGDAVRKASAAFDRFRDNVNRSFGGIHGRTVTVGVAMTASTNPYPGGISGRAATGGFMRGPGTSMSDSIPAWLSNGEYVIRASSVAKYGLGFMHAINAGRFASGGGVNVNPVTPSRSSIDSAVWSGVTRLVRSSWSFIPAAVGGFGSGVARWAGVVAQALRMLGQSLAWVPTVLRRMNQESGGNPYAINLWDSNAARGDPSRGLMQTIGATFNAYAGPFRGLGIYNPLANVYAGLNYALHTYGSLAALNRPGGYRFGGLASFDHGGFLPPRSATLAINGTNRYEPVGAGGIVIEHLNVYPTPLAHPRDIGREIVDAIQSFEKGSGKGWRS